MKCLVFLFFTLPLLASEPQNEMELISKTIGHLIGKNLQSMGVPLDLDALVSGMKESSEGKDAPLSEDKCLEALTILQEESFIAAAKANLLKANEFLQANTDKNSIVSLEEGKLQYRVIQEGSGSEVETYNSPVLRYQGTYLNGQVFGTSSGDEMISLDETIPGLRKGIEGMREGEIREIYIHPDLGYGRAHPHSPNALLIFKVEVLKADASAQAQAAAQAEDSSDPDIPVLR